jgi:hypothetical protein
MMGTTHQDRAIECLRVATEELAAAEAHLREMTKRAHDTAKARSKLTSAASEAVVRKAKVDQEVADERLALAEKGVERARLDLARARQGVLDGEAADRHEVQDVHIARVLELEEQARPLQEQLAAIRAEQERAGQQAIELNDPWYRQTPFQAPPAHHFESVLDIIARARGYTNVVDLLSRTSAPADLLVAHQRRVLAGPVALPAGYLNGMPR